MIRHIIIIVLFPIVAFAKNHPLYYEPKIIELTGVIKTLKFPGPPNYTSIKEGDADETGPYLILQRPINVSASKNNDETPEKNVKLLQLVVRNKNDWSKIQEGNKVHITGTLFHALTGHHHARILLTIKKMSVLSFQPARNNDLHLTYEDNQFMQHENRQD